MIAPRENPLSQAASGLRVALGHDWLTGMRGGERCLEQFCNAFPEAPLVTMLADPSSVSPVIRDRKIVTSFLQRIPGIARNYRKLLPLMPLAATTTKVPDCDVFLTTSSCTAHAFKPPKNAKMVCYCFTPMRYAWLFSKEYLGPVKSMIAEPFFAWLRRWDRRHSGRVDEYIAISRHVQERIRKFYGRDSSIVYPPVDTDRCTPLADGGESNGGYDLVVSALVPYKRVDIAVEAYAKSGRRLRVAGTGSASAALMRKAAPNVEFLGWQSDDAILDLYRNCRFLLFPGEEDFGIVPLEAMACGKPVIAYGRGGATETVVDGRTGVFFAEQDAESLEDAVRRAESIAWDRKAIRDRALEFSIPSFLKALAPHLAR